MMVYIDVKSCLRIGFLENFIILSLNITLSLMAFIKSRKVLDVCGT